MRSHMFDANKSEPDGINFLKPVVNLMQVFQQFNHISE